MPRAFLLLLATIILNKFLSCFTLALSIFFFQKFSSAPVCLSRLECVLKSECQNRSSTTANCTRKQNCAAGNIEKSLAVFVRDRKFQARIRWEYGIGSLHSHNESSDIPLFRYSGRIRFGSLCKADKKTLARAAQLDLSLCHIHAAPSEWLTAAYKFYSA